MKVLTSAYEVAQRFDGLAEVPGTLSNPAILAMLQLDARWPADDQTPWCSAFANYIAFLLGLKRSRSLAARSWLLVGLPITLEDAIAENDVVILKRGGGNQPGPETINAQGHVGFFAGLSGELVRVLGGNQGDEVSIAAFPRTQVLGVRRLF